MSSRFFPLCYEGREEEKARASSAAVIYKCSFLSGLYNECRKLSETIKHITALLTKSQEPRWQLKKDALEIVLGM